jgi:hypothetical protein
MMEVEISARPSKLHGASLQRDGGLLELERSGNEKGELSPGGAP